MYTPINAYQPGALARPAFHHDRNITDVKACIGKATKRRQGPDKVESMGWLLCMRPELLCGDWRTPIYLVGLEEFRSC